jgi:hypothetical protein
MTLEPPVPDPAPPPAPDATTLPYGSYKKSEEHLPPPLEDFTCLPPALRFLDFAKLAQASQEVLAQCQAIISYTPTDHFPGLRPPRTLSHPPDSPTADIPGSPPDQTDVIPAHVLHQRPCCAPPVELQECPEDAEFHRILRRHASERQTLAYEFRKEQAQILNNYYDAQLRENAQRNMVIDHRPLSDALRHISKRIAYPIDHGQQRFYKYPFRCEKLTKKFQKTLEKLQQMQEFRSDALYQKQLMDVQAYGDIHHFDLGAFRVAKLPPPPVKDST